MKKSKVIKGKPLEDRTGSYLGFCTFSRHVGIVRYSQYRICEKRQCRYYVKYRRENVVTASLQ